MASPLIISALSRGAFFREAEKACIRAVKTSALSAIVFDIDHLKEINNQFGRAVGDQTISAVTQEVSQESRIVGRLSGEEFAAVLEECSLPEALAAAERMRMRIARRVLRAQDRLMRFTCSFGVDEWEFGDTIDDLLRRVDVALFDAKAAGRNRVMSYNPAQSNLDSRKRVGPVRIGDR